MWAIIILLMLAVLCGGIFYLVNRICRFKSVNGHFKSKRTARLVCLLGLVAAFAILCLVIGFMNTAVALIHLILIWAICDLIGFIIKKIIKKEFKRYFAGITALIITPVYLAVGCFFAFYVFRTEYNLKTDKQLSGGFKIVGFSDSHIGNTVSPDKLLKYVKKINAEKADIVVIVGDFIDDGTSREEMENACKVLKELKTNYGVFYIFGNHDAGYYSAGRRGYTRDDLINNLTKNGVTVLCDQTASVGGINLIGRLDRQSRDRLPIDKFPAVNDYTVVLDHEPNDYKAESEANVDLVISGHTHGGQLIPINRVGELIGANDFTYGHKIIKNTDFLVSSGIAGWELYFKTGCISEYFVINISN